MNLIDITEENKYEIVSKLREYKHKIIDLTPEDFDIILPIIKGYIYSIETLKKAFVKQLDEYDKIIISAEYKTFREKFGEYVSKLTKNSNVFLSFFDSAINDLYFPFEYDLEINLKKIEPNSTVECLFSAFRGLVNLYLPNPPFNFDDYIDYFNKIFKHTLDFKLFDSDEFIFFEIKRINYLKIATYNVLTILELIIFNNIGKAEEIRNITKDNKVNLPKRLRNEHIQFMRLRKTLDNNKYKEIAKKMDGKYTESSLKAIAKEINDTLGSNNIDAAIRLYEKRYGEL